MAVEINRAGKRVTVIIDFMSDDEAADAEDKMNEELATGETTVTIKRVTATHN